MGRPKYLNNRPEGRSNHRSEGLTKEERHPFPTPAHISDQINRFDLQPASGRPLRLEGLAKTPLLTPTRVSDRGCAKPLLTALLQLAHSELNGTNRLGMPAR